MQKSLVFAVFACSLASGCATFEGYQRVETPHIAMYTNVSAGKYENTLRALEFGYAALANTFFKNNDIGKVDVLFLDDPEFADLMGQFRKAAAVAAVPGKGKETKIGKDGLLILHPFAMSSVELSDAPTTNPARVYATEMLAHMFVQRALPKAPLWFHEGFATYVNNLEIREGDGNAFACFGYYQPIDVFIGLPKMWNMTVEQYATPEVRNWLRSSAHQFLDFTIHGENNRHRGSLAPLVTGLAAGTPSDEVVATAFSGIDMKDLDQRVSLHREAMKEGLATATNLRGLCPFGFVLPPDQRPWSGTATSTEVSSDEIEALFRALRALPYREEFPPYYPPEIIEKVSVPAKETGA